MARRKVKDVVDLMRQSPERRLMDVGIPDEDTCRFCDCTVLETGPWHEENCPQYEFHEEVIDELDDSQFWQEPEGEK